MGTLQQSLDTDLVESSRLSEEKAWERLTELVGAERLSPHDLWKQHVVSQLFECLGYQPLGLELVGRYLAENPNVSWGEMLNQLQAQRLKEEAINPSEVELQLTLNTAQRGVKAAFELIWQNLDSTTQQVSEFLSLFAPEMIPWQLVEFASKPLNWGKEDLNRAKHQLEKWQLIQLIESRKDYYKIHPLIREFLQTKQQVSEQSDKLKRSFIQTMVIIAQQIPDSPNPKEIELIKDAIPHFVEVTQSLTESVRDEEILWLLDRLGNFYKSQGLYEIAKAWFLKCLHVAKCRLGNNHPDVATSLNNLAGLYYAQRCYGEAESFYWQALKLRKKLLGNNRPEVATTLNNLALLYYAQGRYQEAEPLFVEALKIRKRFQRNYSPDVAATLNNLALLYYAQGRYQEAEPLYVEALELRKSILGTHHLDVATTLNNLASLYDAQGRYQEATPLLMQALKVSEQVLGSDHSNTIIFRKNLVTLQSKLEASNFWQPKKLRKKILTLVRRKK
ncbi:tetratricopeptide repeat protein [Allocoleopsis franciscana]|uniref:Tetratricopeptide repeat protein n=1 Tax=Allocoleopsis franciscana PCC 7113 TaxID=1173027 RepID=K9WAL0_9CYAN|nr:tetratricopeptide repeat protein [Allocoleopsis franciscana]AFZ16804.1 tetratricopeptide repeat protein [Allocoleopsis franciscana PCC 7113]